MTACLDSWACTESPPCGPLTKELKMSLSQQDPGRGTTGNDITPPPKKNMENTFLEKSLHMLTRHVDLSIEIANRYKRSSVEFCLQWVEEDFSQCPKQNMPGSTFHAIVAPETNLPPRLVLLFFPLYLLCHSGFFGPLSMPGAEGKHQESSKDFVLC